MLMGRPTPTGAQMRPLTMAASATNAETVTRHLVADAKTFSCSISLACYTAVCAHTVGAPALLRIYYAQSRCTKRSLFIY